MPRQLNIRSDRAHALAARLAARHGKPVARIVEEALQAYEAANGGAETPEERLARWQKLLDQDRKRFCGDESFKIEDLYDPETGLPA